MPELSIIIVAYNMERELPRTVFSAMPPYQTGAELPEVDVVVVDNGSATPLSMDHLAEWVPPGSPVSIENVPPGNPSPVAAINRAVDQCRGEWIGVMIDGARILSPGILGWMLHASRAFRHPFVYTLAAHLGPEIQQVSTKQGYDRQSEDRLLEELAWQENGYRLFTRSVPAPSSQFGWFGPLAESNAFFLRKSDYQRLGGFDESFVAAGGGLANLDFFRRAMDAAFLQPVCLLGEATFHQVHGGITTNHTPGIPRDQLVKDFFKEYAGLRNERYQMSPRPPVLLGSIPAECADFTARFKAAP